MHNHHNFEELSTTDKIFISKDRRKVLNSNFICGKEHDLNVVLQWS